MIFQLDGLVSPHDVVIETSRLRLRPVRPSDLGALHVIERDPEVMKWMTNPVDPEPVAANSPQCNAKMQMLLRPGTFTFAVTLKDATKKPVIGFLGIHKPPSIFHVYDRAVWGQGYATEALRGFLAAYWERFPQGLPGMAPEFHDKLLAQSLAVNVASGRALERAGFTQVSEGLINIGTKLFNVLEKRFEVYRPS